MMLTLEFIDSVPASKVSQMSEIKKLNNTYIIEDNESIKNTIRSELAKLCISHLKWLSKFTPTTMDKEELLKVKRRLTPCINVLSTLTDQQGLDMVFKVIFPKWEL